MKAAILTGYSKKGREVEVRDISVPEPLDREVLIRIQALQKVAAGGSKGKTILRITE